MINVSRFSYLRCKPRATRWYSGQCSCLWLKKSTVQSQVYLYGVCMFMYECIRLRLGENSRANWPFTCMNVMSANYFNAQWKVFSIWCSSFFYFEHRCGAFLLLHCLSVCVHWYANVWCCHVVCTSVWSCPDVSGCVTCHIALRCSMLCCAPSSVMY